MLSGPTRRLRLRCHLQNNYTTAALGSTASATHHQPPQPQSKSDLSAISRLVNQGAHFVLCNTDKKPIYPPTGGVDGKTLSNNPDRKGMQAAPGQDWQNHPAPFDRLRTAWNEPTYLIGLIPHSVGALVVDVDLKDGTAADVERKAAAVRESLGDPLCEVTTRSGGRHLWYRADGYTGNPTWKMPGRVKGQRRSQGQRAGDSVG